MVSDDGEGNISGGPGQGADDIQPAYLQIKTSINYPLIWHEGEVQMSLLGGSFPVRYRRRWVKEGDNRLGGIQHAEGVELRGDRHARVAYTEIDLVVPGKLSEGEVSRGQLIRELTRSAINRLLEVYRVDTDDAYIEPLSLVDLGPIEVHHFDSDGQHMGRFESRDGFALGMQLARRAEPSERAIEMLGQGIGPSLPATLHLDAKRSVILGNPRVAVIHAQSAVEITVRRVVAAHYERRGRSGGEVEHILGCGFKNLLKDHLSRAIGEEFWDTELREEWEEGAYELRNDAVHRGLPVPEPAAVRSIRLCADVINWINDRAGHLAEPPESEA